MLKFSFRTKLVLVMALVVAGVTIAILSVTRSEILLAYRQMLRTQFRAQMEFFTDQQRQRQDILTRRCEELVRSPELIAGLGNGTADQALTNLLGEITNLVDVVRRAETGVATNVAPERPLMLSINERRRALERGIVPRLTEQPLVALLDAEGFFLASTPRPTGPRPTPGGMSGGPSGTKGFSGKRPEGFRPEDKNGDKNAGFPRRPDGPGKEGGRAKGAPDGGEPGRDRLRLLAIARTNAAVLDKQIIGFSALSTPRGDQQLREAIITPVINPADQRLLGLLLVGYPLPDFAERALVNFSRQIDQLNVLSGVWHEGRIFSATIPTNLHERVAERVSEGIQLSAEGRGDFEVEIDGEAFQAFFTVLNPDSPLPKAAVVGLYSLAPIRSQTRGLQLQIAFFDVIALVVALALIFIVSHGLARPLRELVAGTQSIRAGKFDVTVPVRSHDEVGELAASFNEMAAGLAQREQLRNALNIVADREVAEQLIQGKIALGGEVREVSVMFCDIRGFTALTQNMNPADVVHLLNEHMTALTEVVYAHGGVVDKFMGDSIMAVFGAPRSRGEDALNAARAALQMIEIRERLNENATPRLHVGIGIATGPVLAGNMGSANRLNYTVTGERVNLAARLCSQAERCEVVIDQNTQERLGDRIAVETLPELRLKGFSDAVRAFRLRQVLA